MLSSTIAMIFSLKIEVNIKFAEEGNEDEKVGILDVLFHKSKHFTSRLHQDTFENDEIIRLKKEKKVFRYNYFNIFDHWRNNL
jgi:hypothetical protein